MKNVKRTSLSFKTLIRKRKMIKIFNMVNVITPEVTSKLFCINCASVEHSIENCDKKICLVCGSINHALKTCPKLECLKCGKAGHKTSECNNISIQMTSDICGSSKTEVETTNNFLNIRCTKYDVNNTLLQCFEILAQFEEFTAQVGRNKFN